MSNEMKKVSKPKYLLIRSINKISCFFFFFKWWIFEEKNYLSIVHTLFKSCTAFYLNTKFCHNAIAVDIAVGFQYQPPELLKKKTELSWLNFKMLRIQSKLRKFGSYLGCCNSPSIMLV